MCVFVKTVNSNLLVLRSSTKRQLMNLHRGKAKQKWTLISNSKGWHLWEQYFCWAQQGQRTGGIHTRIWERRNCLKTKEEAEIWQVKRWPKKRDLVTSAPMFPSGAELLLALPGLKRTVEGRARRAAFADRSCACLFMQWNSWGFGESFKDEDGCTSCMAFSSG